jgi:hypothetical protein
MKEKLGNIIETKKGQYIKTLEFINEDSLYCPKNCQYLNIKKLGIDNNCGKGFCKEILPIGVCCFKNEIVPADFKKNVTTEKWINGEADINEYVL